MKRHLAHLAVLTLAGAAMSDQKYPGFYDPDSGVVCLQSAYVNEMLAKEHHEDTIARGPTREGFGMELWSGPNHKTWTLVIRPMPGSSCIISTGNSLELL